LYVSDANTTPGADKILLVTVKTGADYLSGGLKWTLETDYSADSSGFGAFKLKGKDAATAVDLTASDMTMTNTGTSLIVTTPLANAPDALWYYYGQFGLGVPLTTGNIYRLKADLTAPGGAANPSILLAINARGTAGYGFTQLNQAPISGGVTASASTWSGYLVPVETKATGPEAQFIVFDSSSTAGGSVTASSIQLQSIDLAAVLGTATSQGTQTSFTVSADGNPSTTAWSYFDTALGSAPVTKPTLSRNPLNGGTGPIVMTAITSTTDINNIGFASFSGPTGAITTTPGKLTLVRANISTPSGDSAKLPTAWMNVDDAATLQAAMLIERDTAATSGPSASGNDYYLVFEPKNATCTFSLRTLVDKTSINGSVQMNELEVLEADMPSEP
jgi:hypothetical protein